MSGLTYRTSKPLEGGLNNAIMNLGQLLADSCSQGHILVLPQLHALRFRQLFDTGKTIQSFRPCLAVEKLPSGAVGIPLSSIAINRQWHFRYMLAPVYRALKLSSHLLAVLEPLLTQARSMAGPNWAAVHLRIEHDWWVKSGFCRPGLMASRLTRRCFDTKTVANLTAANRRARGVTGVVLLYAADKLFTGGPTVNPLADFGQGALKLRLPHNLSYAERATLEMYVAVNAPGGFYGNSYSSFSRGVGILRECARAGSGCARTPRMDQSVAASGRNLPIDQQARGVWSGDSESFAYDCGPANPETRDPEAQTLSVVNKASCTAAAQESSRSQPPNRRRGHERAARKIGTMRE